MEFWKSIYEKLNKGNALACVFVVENKGSSPGKAGFKMLVSSDNELIGSIGGGSGEYQMVELAKTLFLKHKSKPFVRKMVHHPDAIVDNSGMICFGEQTQVFFVMNADDLPFIKRIIDIYAENKNKTIYINSNGIGFLDEMPNSSEKSIAKTENERLNINSWFNFQDDSNWFYFEKIGYAHTVHIFGGGHVSFELSRMLKWLKFRVVVYDNRNNLPTMKKNLSADEIKTIDFEEAYKYVDDNVSNFVVIMTVAHQFDLLILKQMISKKLGYLGMMASRGKKELIATWLAADGISQERIDTIDTPIGMAINSKTPAEISVSIAAKLISIRNTGNTSIDSNSA